MPLSPILYSVELTLKITVKIQLRQNVADHLLNSISLQEHINIWAPETVQASSLFLVAIQSVDSPLK